MKPTQRGWNATELADQTAKQLPAFCKKPTERLVRYYTTVGILDKPARIDADKRRAIYGERQLNQLRVALVASWCGKSVGQIKAMTNIKDDSLKSIAGYCIEPFDESVLKDITVLARFKSLVTGALQKGCAK